MKLQKKHFCLNFNTKNRNGNIVYFHLRLFRLFGFSIYQKINGKIGIRGMLLDNFFFGY